MWAVAATAQTHSRLEGHGGPVMGADVAPNGEFALTASFDNTVGYWTLETGDALFLNEHAAAVNCVRFIDATKAVSGGDDFFVTIWDLETGEALRILEGHRGKVQAVDVSADGALIASASWDGTVIVWDVESGSQQFTLEGHTSNVNDVAFLDDGGLITASADGTIRVWNDQGQKSRVLVRHGFGVNKLLLNEAAGWLAYGAVDGGTRAVDLEGTETLADLTLERRPILAMAARHDGQQIAVGDGQGYVMVVETKDWSISRDFKAAKEGPVWALSYTSDGNTLLAGGIDDNAHFFPLGDDMDGTQMSLEVRDFHQAPETMSNGERQFKRKCSVCHSLDDGGAHRAGPSLKGVFGRKAGKLDGYKFSKAMAGSDLVWSDDTIDKLFDLGPDVFVPGSKMPMQKMTSEQDRRDLIEFLRMNTN